MLLLQNRDLLDRFRAGDRAAMAEVFEHYSEVLARFLRGGFAFTSAEKRMGFKGVNDRQELHDFIAETMRRAFEERARLAYDGLHKYGPYVRRIARNLVIDKLRSKESRFESLDAREGQAEVADEFEEPSTRKTPSGIFERRELHALLKSFLETLPKAEQHFVSLRYQQNLPQEAVAEALKKSRRWVRERELKVRKALIKHLANSGYLKRRAA